MNPNKYISPLYSMEVAEVFLETAVRALGQLPVSMSCPKPYEFWDRAEDIWIALVRLNDDIDAEVKKLQKEQSKAIKKVLSKKKAKKAK